MQILVINQAEVTQVLPMSECINVMEKALGALADGLAMMPARTKMIMSERRDLLILMPSFLKDIKAFGVKVISLFPSNYGTPFDGHQGAVLLFDGEHGYMRAMIDATAVTAIRTGAVSAVATKYLANPDAGDLAILGAGTQGREHLEGMLEVRKIRRVRVWDLYPEQSKTFAERESKRLGIDIEVAATPKAAAAGADIICATSAAKEPILLGEWVSPGAHINAIGAGQPKAREVDSNLVVKSRLYADLQESVMIEAGDFLIPKQEGLIGNDHIRGSIGELVTGRVQGRQAKEEITLFKSLGLAIEDLAAANYVYEQAVKRGLGAKVEFGGSHFASNA